MVRVPHGDGGHGPGRPLRPPGRSGERVPARTRRRNAAGRRRPASRARRCSGWPAGCWPLALAFAGRGALGVAAVGAEAAGAAAVVFLAWRRLGGFTGDVLGAAAVVGETVGLLTLALR